MPENLPQITSHREAPRSPHLRWAEVAARARGGTIFGLHRGGAVDGLPLWGRAPF